MKKLILVLLISNLILSCSIKKNKLNNAIKISQFNDVTDSLNIKYVLQKSFKLSHSQTIGFNLKSKNLWCKIIIDKHIANNRYLLVLNDALIDYISFYYLKNKQWKSKQYGVKTPFSKHHVNYEKTVIPINLSPDQNHIFYLKIKSRIAKDIPIQLISKDDFNTLHNKDLILFGLLYGVLIAFVIYNFIIFLIIRAIFYFNFSLAVLCTGLVQAFLNGHVSFYILPNFPETSFKLFFIFICLGVFFMTTFSQHILDINRIQEKINFILTQILKWFSIAGVGLILLSDYQVFSIFIIILVSCYTLLLFYLGALKSLQGNKTAQLFSIGWIIYFLGIFSNFLRSQNLIAVNWFSTNITFVSYLGEIILFSIALASYYYLKKKEKKLQQLQFTEKLNEEVAFKTKELTKIIKQKNELMREIHHRVKNNIQIITSLFNLKERRTKNKEAKSILESSKNKLKSMALVHEQLYLNNSFSAINTKNYFEQLLKQLIFNYGNSVLLQAQIENLDLNNDQAIPLGLIVNEIVTNSLKYAFKEKPYLLNFQLKKQLNELIIHISDNGIGFNPNKLDKKSLGLTIINGLTQQLNGYLVLKSNHLGTIYILKIPIKK